MKADWLTLYVLSRKHGGQSRRRRRRRLVNGANNRVRMRCARVPAGEEWGQ